MRRRLLAVILLFACGHSPGSTLAKLGGFPQLPCIAIAFGPWRPELDGWIPGAGSGSTLHYVLTNRPPTLLDEDWRALAHDSMAGMHGAWLLSDSAPDVDQRSLQSLLLNWRGGPDDLSLLTPAALGWGFLVRGSLDGTVFRGHAVSFSDFDTGSDPSANVVGQLYACGSPEAAGLAHRSVVSRLDSLISDTAGVQAGTASGKPASPDAVPPNKRMKLSKRVGPDRMF